MGREWSNGTVHFDRTGPTEKSGPPRKVDRFFRNFSGWTEPIHSVLDRNFREFWLNGSRPYICTTIGPFWFEVNRSYCFPLRCFAHSQVVENNGEHSFKHCLIVPVHVDGTKSRSILHVVWKWSYFSKELSGEKNTCFRSNRISAQICCTFVGFGLSVLTLAFNNQSTHSCIH